MLMDPHTIQLHTGRSLPYRLSTITGSNCIVHLSWYNSLCVLIFFNGPFPASLSVHFWSFQSNKTFLTTNNCEKLSIYLLPTWWDLNSWLLVSSFNHLTWDTARNKSYISQNLVEIIPEVLLSIWRPCVQCLPIKFTKEKRLLQFWLSVLSKFESILASLFLFTIHVSTSPSCNHKFIILKIE